VKNSTHPSLPSSGWYPISDKVPVDYDEETLYSSVIREEQPQQGHRSSGPPRAKIHNDYISNIDCIEKDPYVKGHPHSPVVKKKGKMNEKSRNENKKNKNNQ